MSTVNAKPTLQVRMDRDMTVGAGNPCRLNIQADHSIFQGFRIAGLMQWCHTGLVTDETVF